jgi:hypothetical protein
LNLNPNFLRNNLSVRTKIKQLASERPLKNYWPKRIISTLETNPIPFRQFDLKELKGKKILIE